MSTVFEEKDLKELNQVVTDLRGAVEGKTQKTQDEINKLHSIIDGFEEKHQEMIAEKKEKEQKEIEMQEKLELMEKKVLDLSMYKTEVPNAGSKEYKNSPEYKALNIYLKDGESRFFADPISLEFKDYLRTDKEGQGGALVPQIMANIILKQIEEISPIRKFARKWGPINAKTLSIPVRNGIPAAAYEKELEEGENSSSTYRAENLTAYRQQSNVGITIDMLIFSNFDMESEIISDANEAFAKTEGEKFVKGTGVKEPEGILTNTDIETVDTGASGTLTMDDVIKLAAKLKIGYNPIYFFNRDTLATLRVAKDGNNQYLWQIGGTTQPMQINGYDYVVFQDMSSISDGAGAKIVGFGDIFRGYSILDSIQMSIIRDDTTYKKQGLVEFTINRWNTGQVVIPEALKLITIKA